MVKDQWGVLCDNMMPMKLKRTFYRTVMRLALFYECGSKSSKVKKSQEHRIQDAEMLGEGGVLEGY